MLYALAHIEESFMVDNVHKVVLFAPCFVASTTETVEHYDDVTSKIDTEWGVYEFAGPHWGFENFKLCTHISLEDCLSLAAMYSGAQPVSVKAIDHWTMNALANEFMEYNPDFSADNMYTTKVDVT
jgi:hypothetical protein